MVKKIALLSLVLLTAGCAQKLKPGMITMNTTPNIKHEKDIQTDFTAYKSFALCPIAEIVEEPKINPIVEKQILFMVRNQLELLGYDCVDIVEDSDFLVGIIYSNEFITTYIPPTSTTIPWYIPGQTQTTFMNTYSSFSGNVGSHYFSGSGSGWGTATTTTPGYYVPMTVNTPGRYIGSYYPNISVMIFDTASRKSVWSGSAIVSTPEGDIRRSSNVLLPILLGNFPKTQGWGKKIDLKNGIFGCGFLIFTLDGNNFYPVITGIWHGSPAELAGLKAYDIITHVNGQNVLNWPWSKIREGFDKNYGDELSLTINRNNITSDVKLIAEREADAQSKWQRVRIIDLKNSTIAYTVTQAQEQLGKIEITEMFDLIP